MNATVVIPVYNEQDNIRPLVEELARVCREHAEYGVVIVDDGSRDATWTELCACAADFPFLAPLRSPRNEGQSAAMLRGMHAVRTPITVCMDGDLQNNPADIPALVQKIGEWDVVCGYRANRKDTWSRRIGSRLANRVRNWITHDGVRDTGCSLKAFRTECREDLPPLDGVHRFLPAYFRLNGRTVTEVPVDHRPRTHGDSKYTNLKRLPKTIRDLKGFAWYRSRYLRLNQPAESPGSGA